MTIPVPVRADVDSDAALSSWPLPRVHARQGLDLVTIIPDPRAEEVGPYVSIARFTLSDRVFPPHPHAGFTALTYVLRSSPGWMLNRDSLGGSGTIRPGGAHWTIANAGMMHEETPGIDGSEVEGFQIFINHPWSAKTTKPKRHHVEVADVLVLTGHLGAEVRLIMGQWGDHQVDAELPVSPTLADLQLAPGVTLRWERRRGFHALIYVEAGQLTIAAGPGDDQVSVQARGVAKIAPRLEVVTITAGEQGAVVFAFEGEAIGEPVVMGGPFIMGDDAGVADAFARFRSGGMGRLSPRGASSPADATDGTFIDTSGQGH